MQQILIVLLVLPANTSLKQANLAARHALLASIKHRQVNPVVHLVLRVIRQLSSLIVYPIVL